MSDNLMRVQPIRNGTVLDHIKAGRGRKVLDALDLIDKGTTITLLMHVPSKKNSSKDVIKIEDRELSESESQKLAILSPGAHVNIIRNFVVAEKNEAELPESISNVAICSNENCISNNERGAKSKFDIIKGDPLSIRCVYCGRKIVQKVLSSHLFSPSAERILNLTFAVNASGIQNIHWWTYILVQQVFWKILLLF